jgi:hypothetical protein
MPTHTERRAGPLFPFLKSFSVRVRRAETPDAPHMTGHVVGKVDTECLILVGPDADGLRVGEEVIVRMAVRNQMLEFYTQVMETSSGGPRLILLSMPETIETTDLRKGARLNVFIPAEVHYSHGQTVGNDAANVSLIQGRMVNLSRAGCCLSTQRPLAVEQPIRVIFSLPDARNAYRLPAQVRRHMGRAGEGVFVQGVQFDSQTEHLPVLADLQQWISQNLPYTVRG